MTQLSIIIPTYNECPNLPLIVEQLQQILKGHLYEIIIVDDNSEDGTWQLAKEMSLQHQNIQLIRRIHRKGLTSAVIEGFLLGKGESVAVVDADMQHDLRLLPVMLEHMGEYDIVIGSRYLEQKSIPGWNRLRLWGSRLATQLACHFLKREVTDPLSGFFMLKRSIVHEVAPDLYSEGFKILLDLLLKCPRAKIKELHYEFGKRLHGTSKMDTKVVLDFIDLLISQTFFARFSLQFIHYGIIGASGVAVHFAALYLLYVKWGWHYGVSLVFAIEIALLSNYIWNNQWTFARQRFLKSEWWKGLVRYNAACSLGSLYNLAIAWYLVLQGHSWWLASMLGIWVGISWNYLANKTFTWKQ
ncbi:MAG: glycosyltransferase family 2 protein [SAR324 cluster bacterium]|nr:glycosyltransferase family 2 protein [SAR324 cluster bacterium]